MQWIRQSWKLGWKVDAYKNIPGFKELWKRFPEKDWYLMIDDDTYLLLDNLLNFLEGLDPKEPIYMGAPHIQVGCDGIKDYNDSLPFAQGGSGIIISYGAMKKAQHIWDHCMEKYKKCWGGDIRISVCMRDAGVSMKVKKGHGRFNEDPNTKGHNMASKPACHQPVSFHHVTPKQMQFLYSIEKERQGNLRYSDLFSADITRRINEIKLEDRNQKIRSKNGLPQKSHQNRSDPIWQALNLHLDNIHHSTIEPNIQRKGRIRSKRKTSSYQECKTSCEKDSKCSSWMYEKGTCHVMSVIPAPKVKAGVTSGVIRGRYVCKR